MLKFIILSCFCAVATFALRKEFNATNYFPANNQIVEGKRHFFRLNSSDMVQVEASKYLHTQDLYHSFECTFRLQNNSLNRYSDHWYLFDVQSQEGNRLYLALSSNRKRIIFYADWNKSVSKFEFDYVQVFDGKWHNIMYSIDNRKFSLFVDCELRMSTDKATKSRLQKPLKGKFTPSHELLFLEIAQSVNSKVTVPIDISKMRFHTYPRMPVYARCEDIGGSHRVFFNSHGTPNYPANFNHLTSNSCCMGSNQLMIIISIALLFRIYV